MSNLKSIKLAYKSFVPAEGADATLSPIIFLHGVTALKEYWMDIPQIVADGTKRKAYAYDARNHGDSEYTKEFSFDLNVVDLFHFMDTINAPKAILVGHSMGGITATKAALEKPERIEMIISEDMFAKECPKEIILNICGFINLWVTAIRSIPKELSPADAVTSAVDFIYRQAPEVSSFLSDREKMNKLPLEFKRTPDGGYDVKYNKEVLVEAMQNVDNLMSDLKGQYNGPAFFIYGSVSPFNVGKQEESIQSCFPKSKLIEFEGATHNVHVEFPEKFAKTVIQCLKK